MDIQHAQKLCTQFCLGRFISCENAGGTRNVNFVFQTESGAWFVRRRFENYSTPEQIAFDHSAARFLHRGNVPVALPRCDADGNSWWHDGTHVWEVLTFVEGRQLQDGSPQDIAALGLALSQWHRVGETFPARYVKAAPRSETDPQQLLKRISQIEAESPETMKIVAGYRSAVEWAAGELDDEKYFALPHTLIHGDVQPANVLMHEAKVAAFVDLDWCTWQARIYDLCFALLTCCAIHQETFDGSNIWSLTQTPILQRDRIELFLNSYASTFMPLTADETQALRPQMALTWCHARLGGALKVEPMQRQKFLQRPPDITDFSWLPMP